MDFAFPYKRFGRQMGRFSTRSSHLSIPHYLSSDCGPLIAKSPADIATACVVATAVSSYPSTCRVCEETVNNRRAFYRSVYNMPTVTAYLIDASGWLEGTQNGWTHLHGISSGCRNRHRRLGNMILSTLPMSREHDAKQHQLLRILI